MTGNKTTFSEMLKSIVEVVLFNKELTMGIYSRCREILWVVMVVFTNVRITVF